MSDYSLMTYLPFCKVMFKSPEKSHIITPTVHVWTLVLHTRQYKIVLHHNRSWQNSRLLRLLSTKLKLEFGTKHHIRRRNLWTANGHNVLKAVSCFWETSTFLKFSKSVSWKTAQIRGQYEWEQEHWTGCQAVPLLFLKHSALVTCCSSLGASGHPSST